MFTLLLSVILVLAVLLILVILGQNSKGGAGAAFGGSASQIMGVTRTGNVLEKATWILANFETAKEQVVAPAFGDTQNAIPAQGVTPTDTTTTK